jgi:cobalt-zinc-cadmium efflux system membrane fusion protein
MKTLPILSARVLCVLAAFTVACSRDRHKPAGQMSKADTGMADMPGMTRGETTHVERSDGGHPAEEGAVASSIRFTAAQIEHGSIRWQAVVMGKAMATATVPGQLVPNEDLTARLGATGRGRVLTVHVRPGDRVSRGQVLVTLQSPEAGAAQSDLAKAEAEVASRKAQAAYAQSARERAERLLSLKAIPRQDYERAVADDELARSTLTQAEAELQRARSTAEQLGADEAPSGEITIRSPLAGAVLNRTAVPGTVVEAGAPLVVVSDVSSLWLSINAPEKLAPLFAVGHRLRFSVPSYPSDTFVARIEAVGAGLEPETRTLLVRAVTGSGSGKLKPEMLANVSVESGDTVGAALLPDEAVQLFDGKPTVFVATPHERGGALFTRREVELGTLGAGKVAVTRGLAVGELVVINGALAIKAQLAKGSMPEMEM